MLSLGTKKEAATDDAPPKPIFRLRHLPHVCVFWFEDSTEAPTSKLAV